MADDPVAWAVKTALFRSPAATRSPPTTPPVIPVKDHVVAAVLAIKLPYWSRVLLYTVMAEPGYTVWADTRTAEPVAAVSIRIWLAAAVLTVIPLWVPVIVVEPAWVAIIDCVPAVFSVVVAVIVLVPLSPAI